MDVKQHGTAGIGMIRHMYGSARQFPNQPGVDRAEEQFALLRPFSRSGNIVQKPLDLGTGKIGIGHKACFRTDNVRNAFGYKIVNNIRSTAALPDNCVGNGLAGFFVPDNRRFPLIRDADRCDVVGCHVELPHGCAGNLQRCEPDFLRVMLDPAGLRKDLPEFLLGNGADVACFVEEDAT